MACARTVWLIIVVATAFLIRCTYESKLSRVTMTLHGLFTSLRLIRMTRICGTLHLVDKLARIFS